MWFTSVSEDVIPNFVTLLTKWITYLEIPNIRSISSTCIQAIIGPYVEHMRQPKKAFISWMEQLIVWTYLHNLNIPFHCTLSQYQTKHNVKPQSSGPGSNYRSSIVWLLMAMYNKRVLKRLIESRRDRLGVRISNVVLDLSMADFLSLYIWCAAVGIESI